MSINYLIYSGSYFPHQGHSSADRGSDRLDFKFSILHLDFFLVTVEIDLIVQETQTLNPLKEIVLVEFDFKFVETGAVQFLGVYLLGYQLELFFSPNKFLFDEFTDNHQVVNQILHIHFLQILDGIFVFVF
jgi:hypothetical protein